MPQHPRDAMPPSPPRSRRDPSETPSVGLPLGMAFGANGGGKWWDEELVSHAPIGVHGATTNILVARATILIELDPRIIPKVGRR